MRPCPQRRRMPCPKPTHAAAALSDVLELRDGELRDADKRQALRARAWDKEQARLTELAGAAAPRDGGRGGGGR